MAKKLNAVVKLQLPAGKATSGPPVGSSLGPHGINIPRIENEYNERTNEQLALINPLVKSIYSDRTFTFVLKSPPAAVLIKKAVGIESASAKPNRDKVAKITDAQIEEIAKLKMADLNASCLEQAKSMIRGTARSMGVIAEG